VPITPLLAPLISEYLGNPLFLFLPKFKYFTLVLIAGKEEIEQQNLDKAV
jgi:hypothetical protein